MAKGRVDIGKPFTPSFKRSSGGTSGLSTLMGYMMGKQQQSQIGSTAADVKGQLSEAFPGGVPVGTKLNVGGKNTTAQVDLNRSVNESEANAIAGSRSLEPVMSKVESLINGGVLKEDTFGRLVDQGVIDFGQSILASDKDRIEGMEDSSLEDLLSSVNALKSQLPFSAGGKQLTDTEKELVFRGLNFFGKSESSILRDLNQSMAILREKENLAMGGIESQPLSVNPKGSSTKSKFALGQTIKLPDGREATVVGLDDPNDPDLELIS